MVVILMLLGGLAATWTWQHVHPVAGVAVGFLLIGGLGWQLLGAGLTKLSPTVRRHGGEFREAWRASAYGAMEQLWAESDYRDYGDGFRPPPGTFSAWVKEHKRTGISAAEWLNKTEIFPTG